jgi:hypothetical protein
VTRTHKRYIDLDHRALKRSGIGPLDRVSKESCHFKTGFVSRSLWCAEALELSALTPPERANSIVVRIGKRFRILQCPRK